MKFRSKFEERIYEDAERKGKSLRFEPADIVINYTINYRYWPDFELPNGILVEAKGYLRPKDRTKMIQVKKENPSLDIRFVFQRANTKLTKGKNSMTYGQWADKHSFPWAETKIPLEWFREKRKKTDCQDN